MDLRSIFLGLSFALMWSSAFVSARIIVLEAPPLMALSLRFFVSGTVAVGIALLLKQSWQLSKSQWRATIVFGLCQNALYLGLNFIAMQTVQASIAAIIASTMPLLVALDGITDPRNLGAIIRSVAAFGAHGIVLPQRRSVGVTASAWKTSAGAAARIPVALASNLNQVIKEYQRRGLFVVGLAAGGDVMLPDFDLNDKPLLVIVGSEGKGLSRLVQENCDQVVSIPISSDTESLNAGIAASVALYQIAANR